jgi:hypothetical protein
LKPDLATEQNPGIRRVEAVQPYIIEIRRIRDGSEVTVGREGIE